MSDRIHELLNRNLQEVFSEGDAARRRAAIEELYTDDCVLYVPPGVFVGHDALDKFAADLRATQPHFVYTPHGEPQSLHNAGRPACGEAGPGRDHPARRQDRRALCVPRFNALMTGVRRNRRGTEETVTVPEEMRPDLSAGIEIRD